MASEIAVSFGERVRQRRIRVKMTQVELCEKTGMKQSTLSEVENGHHAATLDTVAKIAKALNTTAAALLAEK